MQCAVCLKEDETVIKMVEPVTKEEGSEVMLCSSCLDDVIATLEKK